MDQPTEDVGVIFTAGQAAQQLEVSASSLRRLANAYEGVFGELPRDPGTQARGYPEEAIERIRAARRGVEAGQYKSTQAALSALKRGVPVDAGEMAGPLTWPQLALEAFLRAVGKADVYFTQRVCGDAA